MRKLIWFTLLFVFFCVTLTFGQKLKLLFFHRPPYYVYANKRASGIILERAILVLKKSGVPFEVKLSTPNRIIVSFKKGDKGLCSPGWFKTKNRLKWAKFSLPIFENRPLVVLTGKWNQRLIKKHKLTDIFRDRSCTWGKINNFSYGEEVEGYQRIFRPKIVNVDGTQLDLIRMLRFKRFSYMLISPEEVDFLISSAGYKKKILLFYRCLMLKREIKDI
ncbi:hypothetical protein JCM13304A_11120 [Desulfothermus okinawensis JCM 13304]